MSDAQPLPFGRPPKRPFSVVVVGGGLAGCSAALGLARNGVKVTLLESRRRLGGRTGSFHMPAPAESQAELGSHIQAVDYCQHVGMGCCTNLRQLIEWLDQTADWATHRQLHFFGPSGDYQCLKALPLLPAPLHLASWLVRWPGIGWRERFGIARGMLAIGALKQSAALDQTNALEWLQSQGQSPDGIEKFWNTIIVSALGEVPERVSLDAVRKVIQDGFLNHRDAFHLLVPQRPLDELFGQQMLQQLRRHAVDVRLGTAAESICCPSSDDRFGQSGASVSMKSETLDADAVVIAVPWHQIQRLASASQFPQLSSVGHAASQLRSSPISGVHTWWDQPWLELPHAALVGRLCQWVFPQPSSLGSAAGQTYYQIVISASRDLPRVEDKQLMELIAEDLRAVFPAARNSRLLKLKVVTDPMAVFSIGPGARALRPSTRLTPQCCIAGDWTDSGWPATMEGAIISGFRAAETLLDQAGAAVKIVAPPL